MADTTFVDFTVPAVNAAWLNDVNDNIYDTSTAPVGTFKNSLANTSDISKGDALIGVKYPASGSVARTQHQKNTDLVTVLDFGAVGDGVTDDTAAFTSAQAAAAFIRVPTGLNCKVGSGLNYWQFFGEGKVFEPGIQWDLSRAPQTPAAVGKFYKARTFGIYEQAAGMSVSINSTDAQTRQNTQILGTTTQGLASTYNDRDHVGTYIQAWSYAPDTTDATTTYSATTLTNTTVSTLNTAGKLLPGMIIDTQHATPYTGRIQSVTGNVITVDAWYLRVTGVAGTPANGTGVTINPNTKIWGQNTNLFLAGNAGNKQAQTGTGYELGISCDPTVGVGVWGFDVVTLGGTPERHFTSRGTATNGFYAATGKTYAYASKSNNRGFSSQDDSLPFEAVQGANTVFAINTDGSAVSNGIKGIGVGALQCTNAAFVNVGPLPSAYGGMFWVSGFNLANGNEANFLVVVRSGLAGIAFTSDGSGLAIAFQATGRQLQIKCGNAGTFQFVAHGFVA